MTARSAAAHEMATRVHGRVPQARRVDAGISSFPFVGRLLVAGRVGHVRLAAAGVRVGPSGASVIDIESIVVDAHDVTVDRDQLVGHRRVVLTGVGHGDVRAIVTGAAISSAVGVPVTLADNAARVLFHGATITARVEFRGGAVVIGIAGASLRVPLPNVPLMPCQPTATVFGDRVVLTCSFDRIPPEMIGAAQRISTS